LGRQCDDGLVGSKSATEIAPMYFVSHKLDDIRLRRRLNVRGAFDLDPRLQCRDCAARASQPEVDLATVISPSDYQACRRYANLLKQIMRPRDCEFVGAAPRPTQARPFLIIE